MRLTKQRIHAIEPPAQGYDIRWDEITQGLGVRVTSSGVKSFIYQRRIKGRSRRMTLGRFPTMSVEKARDRVIKLAAAISDGKDPVVEEQRAAAQRVTLKEAQDAYLESRSLKPNTVRDINLAMKALKDWMTRPVVEITPAMVEKRHAELGKKSAARANLTMRYLRAILNYAASRWADDEGHPLIPYNPVKRLSATKAWYRVERRRTLLKEHDIAPWWDAVDKLGEDPSVLRGPQHRDFMILLLLTGLRRGEALNLRWDGVDFKGRTLTVEDTKNRETHTLPLPQHLQELLAERKKVSKGEYVFNGPDGERFSDFSTIVDYVEAKTAETLSKEAHEPVPGLHITPHDLRRTFATIAERLDIPHYALKRLLNHKQSGDVTAGYIVADVERLREPMEKITDFVLKAAGVRSGAPVSALAGARG